jgi:DNA-binding NtrC family response regulator
LGATAALEIVRDELPFAVVVSDHNMPETDGVAFLAKMREIAPHTVRILLTGQADAKIKALATTVGAVFRFVAKPCESATLGAILDAAVIEHHLLLSQASTKIVPAPAGSGTR